MLLLALTSWVAASCSKEDAATPKPEADGPTTEQIVFTRESGVPAPLPVSGIYFTIRSRLAAAGHLPVPALHQDPEKARGRLAARR